MNSGSAGSVIYSVVMCHCSVLSLWPKKENSYCNFENNEFIIINAVVNIINAAVCSVSEQVCSLLSVKFLCHTSDVDSV